MKKIRLLFLLPLTMVFAACPYESKVPLAEKPTEPVDSALLGYWYGIVRDGSDYFGIEALEVSKKTDSIYAITRYGKAVKGDIILPDTAFFTGYTSYIDEQRFMNIEGSIFIEVPRRNKPSEMREEKVYYLSALHLKKDTLHIRTITENFTPSRRLIKAPSDLVKLVTESLGQQKNIYDEQYSLQYRKMIKPVPIIR